MALMISVSGVRGTIGGQPASNLTPVDVVAFAAAYGSLLLDAGGKRVVVGRDARPSGPMIASLASQTLVAMGFEVIDLGLTTTPTLSMYVPKAQADGGIMLTASHNPVEWNALKCFDADGAFISAELGEKLKALYAQGDFSFAEVARLGRIVSDDKALAYHIDEILKLPLVDFEAVRKAGFQVALDPVNSTGAVAVPALLERMGVKTCSVIHGEMSGRFAHNPEPLPEHLGDLSKYVVEHKLDLGIAVDPDVDRLALVMENGEAFGEEYTLVAVADYWLSHDAGPVVSNLSSSMALDVVARRHGQQRHTSAVGEAHVVSKMRAVGAELGGEGNGGVIVGPLHYGRDALAGIALFLTHLAKSGKSCSQLRAELPEFQMVKKRIDLSGAFDAETWASRLQAIFPEGEIDRTDGVRVALSEGWLHLRPSNTEPIARLYAEARTAEEAERLCALLAPEHA